LPVSMKFSAALSSGFDLSRSVSGSVFRLVAEP
jgi:hypothetical protein